jgi:hypothetical protein
MSILGTFPSFLNLFSLIDCAPKTPDGFMPLLPILGAIGIGMTLLMNLPINWIVHDLTGIYSLNSVLPWQGAVGLVAISMFLTYIAGLIPSGIAAKKDPVEALRTE